MTGAVEPLTPVEHEALEVTNHLVHLLMSIVGSVDPQVAETDASELIYHVHAIQNAILAQAAARAYPDRYRFLGRRHPSG